MIIKSEKQRIMHEIALATYAEFKATKYTWYEGGGKPLCYCANAYLRRNIYPSKYMLHVDLVNEFKLLIKTFFKYKYHMFIGDGINDSNEIRQIRETVCLLLIEMTK